MYTISCEYVRGCDMTECSYNLTSGNDSFSGTLRGSYSVTIELGKIIYALTVADHDGFIVQSEELDLSNVNSCPTSTG